MSATDLDQARRTVIQAMREAHNAARIVGEHNRTVIGWLHREDGSWAPVDDRGRVGRVFAYGPYDDGDLYDDVAGALAAVADPLVIDVEPLYTPALQRLLEIAERIARDSGATTVDVAHVEIALDRRRTEGDT